MARHVWTVLCRASSIDKDSGELSLFQVMEGFTISGPLSEALEGTPTGSLPVAPMNILLVSFWVRSDPAKPEKNARVRYVMVTPTGKRIAETEASISLHDNQRSRHKLIINHFPIFGKDGTYEWRTQVPGKKSGSWRTVARTPFEVTFQDEPSAVDAES